MARTREARQRKARTNDRANSVVQSPVHTIWQRMSLSCYGVFPRYKTTRNPWCQQESKVCEKETAFPEYGKGRNGKAGVLKRGALTLEVHAKLTLEYAAAGFRRGEAIRNRTPRSK